MSLVSVVVPTRNRSHLVARALRSILGQRHRPLEVVVVDDGSTDRTREAVKALGSDDVHFVKHDHQRGAAAARNTGIERARGEFLAFLDDDDEWLPERLERTLAALSSARPEVCAVYTGMHLVSERGGIARTSIPGPEPRTLADFLRTTGFGTSAALLRSRCVAEIGGFDERLPGGQDHDLWIRLSERSTFLPLREALVKHYVHGDQITTDLPRKIRSKEMILQKHRARYEDHPFAHAQQLERLGMLHCAGGSLQRGRECLTRSLELDPLREAARDHLERSRSDPEAHRQHLLEQAFDRVAGITRFY